MSEPERDVPEDNEGRESRLAAQHELLALPAALPTGLVAGLFLALPPASLEEGLSMTILSTGLASVLLLLGLGLLLLALVQGLPGQIRRRWTLALPRDRLSATEKLVWNEALAGLTAIGAAFGWLLAFYLT